MTIAVVVVIILIFMIIAIVLVVVVVLMRRQRQTTKSYPVADTGLAIGKITCTYFPEPFLTSLKSHYDGYKLPVNVTSYACNRTVSYLSVYTWHE